MCILTCKYKENIWSLAMQYEEDQLTSIRHIRRLTHPTRTAANLGSGSSGNNTGGTAGGGSGNSAVSRSSRAAMMQLIELPSLSGAGLSAAARDPMDPIAGQSRLVTFSVASEMRLVQSIASLCCC